MESDTRKIDSQAECLRVPAVIFQAQFYCLPARPDAINDLKVNPMPKTFSIEANRYPLFHRALLKHKVVFVREGRGWVSSVGFAIQDGKPVFNVTLEDSRAPITAPWYLRDSQYKKFVESTSRVRK